LEFASEDALQFFLHGRKPIIEVLGATFGNLPISATVKRFIVHKWRMVDGPIIRFGLPKAEVSRDLMKMYHCKMEMYEGTPNFVRCESVVIIRLLVTMMPSSVSFSSC